jgi:hypothetical protein
MRLARVRAGNSATPFDDAAEMVFNAGTDALPASLSNVTVEAVL